MSSGADNLLTNAQVARPESSLTDRTSSGDGVKAEAFDRNVDASSIKDVLVGSTIEDDRDAKCSSGSISDIVCDVLNLEARNAGQAVS